MRQATIYGIGLSVSSYPQKAVTLLSGGLDSAAATQFAIEQGVQPILALTFDYGQRAARQELRAAKALCEYFKIPHRAITLDWFREFSGALTNQEERVPTPLKNELDNKVVCDETAKAVWVPNRNGVFLEIAAGFAENLGARFVVTGFNAEEAVTFPDNSVSYREALNRALSFSTNDRVIIISPTETFTKGEIVKRLGLRFPFSLLWSCYYNGEKPCRVCESCQRFFRATDTE